MVAAEAAHKALEKSGSFYFSDFHFQMYRKTEAPFVLEI